MEVEEEERERVIREEVDDKDGGYHKPRGGRRMKVPIYSLVYIQEGHRRGYSIH